jgi:hypothetical protein
LRRGGPQTSDMLTMTEYITRHDDLLSILQVVDDPDLSRRAVRAVDHLHLRSQRWSGDGECSGSSFAENGGRDRHWVPHFLPGQNSGIGEFLKTQSWIPFEPCAVA